MDSHKDPSEGGDPEDIPSDFFDDFNKDEFMQGLSVIDSWDDDDTGKRRIDAETVDSVKDLRELIDGKDDDKSRKSRGDGNFDIDSKHKLQKEREKGSNTENRRSGSRSRLDDYIKPGSRRDPNKTNEAIKRDKEVKVKELIAKHLDDDIRPPGTELDDYYSEGKVSERKKTPATIVEQPQPRSHSREYKTELSNRSSPTKRHRESPNRHKESPGRYRESHFRHRSPLRHQRELPFRNNYGRMSPLGRNRRSPQRRSPRRDLRRSPQRNFRHQSPQRKSRRYSPQRRSPRRMSPPRRSPRRRSPLERSPRHGCRSRSPKNSWSSYGRQSHSPKPYQRDTFLYPNEKSGFPMAGTPYSKGPYTGSSEYSGGPPGYAYPDSQPYAGGYGAPGYEYGVQPDVSNIALPQPVPAPALAVDPVTNPAAPTPLMSISLPMNAAPSMVPPPSQMISPSGIGTAATTTSSHPYDALAQLVADGKLSQEDYLKLAPNKGVSNNFDNKTRVMVLTRCNMAISKLTRLLLPNRLMMHQNIVGQEPKYLAPKYCSPLKRQVPIEFQFTKSTGASMQQNKQLVDSIITTIGLEKVVSRPKKKIAKDMKDAAVQTTKPYCDVCEIREATRSYNSSTSIDPEHFSTSVHTQVVEHDLYSSKSIFNPTGSASDSAPISIAHMTPAQLVSQLAARAKTLKQTSEPGPAPNQWRNPPSYDNRGVHYNNYGNYRY